jgi:hypothetical protein
MRNRPYRGRGQLVLELEPRTHQPLVAGSPKGLVETLADLLLEALRAEEGVAPAITGGDDEQQDIA